MNDEAERARKDNWNGFFIAHAEPDRPRELLKIEPELSDTEYWKLVRLVWTQADIPSRQPNEWRKILTSGRLNRHEIMEPDERKFLSTMKDRVRVCRGHTDNNRDGFSWTTIDSKAHEFAKMTDRHPAQGVPQVTSGWVDRKNIIAFFCKMDEQEILVDPNCVSERETITA